MPATSESYPAARLPTRAEFRQVCTKTVMDTSDPDIIFDNEGVSNYWHQYQDFKDALPSVVEREAQLLRTVEAIRAAGRGKRYDCVVGLSGGVDSSYIALLAHEFGLRPLVVHFDNGWNSELAISNIEKIVTTFGFELDTFVMDWEEFRDLQRAYFKASVVDLEVPTDHMISGALARVAAKHGIRTILAGMNYATEWLMPPAWIWNKHDLVNLKGIHRLFGERRLKHLPAMSVWLEAYFHYRHGQRSIRLLNLVNYSKAMAKGRLMAEVGWRDYGGKHYESVFTRFYQGCILPQKFGVDKRRAHLSSLILAGEITRAEAVSELQQPPYDEGLQARDRAYVGKKLGWSDAEFRAILSLPNVDHSAYGTDAGHRARYQALISLASGLRHGSSR